MTLQVSIVNVTRKLIKNRKLVVTSTCRDLYVEPKLGVDFVIVREFQKENGYNKSKIKIDDAFQISLGLVGR